MEEKFERRNEDNGVGKTEKSGACDSILGSTYKQIRRKLLTIFSVYGDLTIC